MDVPNMSRSEFMQQSPGELFLFVTSYLYEARKRGNARDVDAVLSVFDADARRAVIIGSGALLCMDKESDYSRAMRAAISAVLYNEFRRENK